MVFLRKHDASMSSEMAEKKDSSWRYFGRREWKQIALVLSTGIPFVVVIFLQVGRQSALAVSVATGLAIVAGAYALSWATEAMETVVSQAFALAVLALIEVAPEYSFEAVLAWQRQVKFAAATMTGANRLLLGIGWPVVLFIAYFAGRRRGKRVTYIQLDRTQSLEVLLLLVAALYSLVIVATGQLSVWDGLVLLAMYVVYVVAALRLPSGGELGEEEKEGQAPVSQALSRSHGWLKAILLAVLLGFGGFVIVFGAEPFIDGLLAVAVSLGIQQYMFIQWAAPFLSEFPESTTAFLWAARPRLGSMSIANLVSSKLNQWTLLIGTIPIVYSLSVGRLAAVPLDTEQVHEILLTAAQTFFGIAALINLRFEMREAIILLGLFLVQFFMPETRLWVAAAYMVLAAVELYVQRRELHVLAEGWQAIFPRRRPAPAPRGSAGGD